MPPRFAYWTILIDDKPTAFRAQYKEDLQPTFFQLQRTNPNAVMRWFARGKLWDNPEQAQWAARNLREAHMAREKRPREWRPGGEHKDPRARFDGRRRDERAPGVRSKPERYGAKPPTGGGKPPWRPKPAGAGRVFARPSASGEKPPWRPKPAGVGRAFRPANKDNRGRKR